MKIQKNEDQTICILSEKDVEEALIQYIENWENFKVPEEREFLFVGNKLHIVTESTQSKIELSQKQKKLSRKERTAQRQKLRQSK